MLGTVWNRKYGWCLSTQFPDGEDSYAQQVGPKSNEYPLFGWNLLNAKSGFTFGWWVP